MQQQVDEIDPATSPKEALQRLEVLLEKGEIAAAHSIQRRFWDVKGGLSAVDYRRNPSLLRWPHDFDAAPEGEFLFISGTPRSSTTALGKVMRLHPDVSLFVEVFGYNTGYVPQMLTPSNIQRLRETGALKAELKPENVALIEGGRIGRLVGDKRPNFMQSAALTLCNFKGRRVSILHIARDIREVAASYMRRAAGGTFPAHYDHRMAVRHMNMNTRNALALVDGLDPQHRLLVLDYATFWSRPVNARRLMREVGLDPLQVKRGAVGKLFRHSQALLERDRSLPAEAEAYIEEHFDAAAFERLRAMAFA
jgi:Sulfotransferase domain